MVIQAQQQVSHLSQDFINSSFLTQMNPWKMYICCGETLCLKMDKYLNFPQVVLKSKVPKLLKERLLHLIMILNILLPSTI